MDALGSIASYAALVALALAALLLLSRLLGERRRNRSTNRPYESGVLPVGDARLRFPAKFYLVAVLFVVFDLETVFLMAWAVALREAGWAGFVEAMIFLLVLFVALAYLWRLGALDWNRPPRAHARTEAG